MENSHLGFLYVVLLKLGKYFTWSVLVIVFDLNKSHSAYLVKMTSESTTKQSKTKIVPPNATYKALKKMVEKYLHCFHQNVLQAFQNTISKKFPFYTKIKKSSFSRS